MSSASPGSSSSKRIRRGDVTLSSYAAWWRLVDDRPEDAQFFDGVDELVEINRLYDIGVDPELVASDHVSFLVGGRQHHHRDHLQALIGPDLLQDLQSIDLG